jgi:1-deoxy-D-xylulose-5-phosphate reductoisomerase
LVKEGEGLKKISILGSTGSIGTQSLEVIRGLKNIEVLALSTNVNIDLLEQQIEEFKPQYVVVNDEKKAYELKHRVTNLKVEVLTGIEGLIEIATLPEIDMVLTSVVGNVGLLPTLKAIQAGKDIALANKETLVTAGKLVMSEAAKHGVNIYPVDSEHSAIFQSLQGNKHNKINKLYLTASGGPFRKKTLEELKSVTLEDALNHPNWSMGRKITIDSATMMNKGLEVIEAKWLFDVEASDIHILVHPQSIVHSMVEYEDGAVIAQLGEPDMKVPIQYALTYPDRVKNNFPKINFFERSKLEFEKPDTDKFTCISLAYEALKIGGDMPAVLNSANEAAVELFLNRKIEFLDIAKLIELTMNAYTVKYDYILEDLVQSDIWSRAFVNQKAKNL